MSRKLTQEEFLSRAFLAHGDTYSYAHAVYVDEKHKVTITCSVHGDFEQLPKGHCNGKGCAKCALIARATTKKQNAGNVFLSKVFARCGDKYDLSKATYSGARVPTTVICKIHGAFQITPNNLLSGKGCPDCAVSGFSQIKPGSLYVLQYDNITKVGITNKTVSKRIRQIELNSGKLFKELLSVRFEDGHITNEVENLILKELRSTYKQPLEKFDGSTECFYDVDISALVSMLGYAASKAFSNIKQKE